MRHKRRNTERLRFAAVALISLPLVACGGHAAGSGIQHSIYAHGASLLPRGDEDALITGEMSTRNGCVVLAARGSDAAYPVIWPSGTSIADEEPLTLALPSGADLTLGQASGLHQGTREWACVGTWSPLEACKLGRWALLWMRLRLGIAWGGSVLVCAPWLGLSGSVLRGGALKLRANGPHAGDRARPGDVVA